MSKISESKATLDTCVRLAAQIDANKEEPIYRQILAIMERFIEEGRLRPGERLPPERKLMEILGVSRSTLRLALAELIERRYLSATQGRGNFVLEPQKKRLLLILVIERFHADHWSVAPLHYDWINEGGKAAGARIHYHYAPTDEEMIAELTSPPTGYDAILFFRTPPDWSRLLDATPDSVFEKSPVPIMVIGRPIRKRGLNTLTWDYREATRLATRRLIEAGHKRIGFLSGKPVHGHSFAAFHEGYISAMREAGLPLHEEDQLLFDEPIIVGGVVTEETHERTADFLRRRAFTAAIPTTLISSSFERAVRKEGILVPEELAVMVVSEEHAIEQSVIRWSGFWEPSASIVQNGVAMLVDICRGVRTPGMFELLSPEEHTGATVGKR